MNPNDPIHDDAEQGLPDEAREAIKRLFSGAMPDNPASDHALRSFAQQQLQPSQRRSTLTRNARIAAAVALLVIGSALALRWNLQPAAPSAHRSASAPAKPGDIDRDGAIDVRDAFIVASAIERGDSIEPDWDLDNDGAINDRDVQVILALAVSLQTLAPAPEGAR